MCKATSPVSASLTTQQVLCASQAIFTLEGMGRSWTFRFEEGTFDDGRPSLYFAQVLMGDEFVYVGVYSPSQGHIRLTRASKFDDQSEVVRALRWYVGLVHIDSEDLVSLQGFQIHWAPTCAYCGGALRPSKSMDARLHAKCARLVAQGL